MSRAIPLLRHGASLHEGLRLVLVYGCALVLIGAGPFIAAIFR